MFIKRKVSKIFANNSKNISSTKIFDISIASWILNIYACVSLMNILQEFGSKDHLAKNSWFIIFWQNFDLKLVILSKFSKSYTNYPIVWFWVQLGPLYNSLTPNSTAQSAINIFQSPYSTPKTFLVTECYMEIQIALQKYFRSLYKE